MGNDNFLKFKKRDPKTQVSEVMGNGNIMGIDSEPKFDRTIGSEIAAGFPRLILGDILSLPVDIICTCVRDLLPFPLAKREAGEVSSILKSSGSPEIGSRWFVEWLYEVWGSCERKCIASNKPSERYGALPRNYDIMEYCSDITTAYYVLIGSFGYDKYGLFDSATKLCNPLILPDWFYELDFPEYADPSVEHLADCTAAVDKISEIEKRVVERSGIVRIWENPGRKPHKRG